MKISIFGLGYVGCVSLGCLAQKGHFVIGVDVDSNKVKLINEGKPTVIERGLDEIITKAFKEKKIEATLDYKKAVLESDISIISVGTPSTSNGHLNLKYIYKVAEEIGDALKDKTSFHIVSIRSTVMPGTNKLVGEIIEKSSLKKRNVHFAIVSNPEFLREGTAIRDYFNPSVTVLGSDNQYAIDKMKELYNDLNAPIKKVSIEVAEIIKYVNNSFHALKITFANEVGNICKKLGIDSHEVMDLFIMDTQLNLSPYYLKPGFAYGGSCLPKDLKGLKTIAHDLYLSCPVLESIENSNRLHKRLAIEMIEKYGQDKIGILGLSFKDGTDDLRNSPIVEIAEYFLGKGCNILIYDKNVSVSKLTGTNKEYINDHISHLSELISDNIEEVVKNSKLVVITYKIDGLPALIEQYKDTIFIDFVRVTSQKFENYEGICW
jgi:GDP-mannose 6-dehydrogenase